VAQQVVIGWSLYQDGFVQRDLAEHVAAYCAAHGDAQIRDLASCSLSRTWRGAWVASCRASPALLITVLVKAPTNDDLLSHGEDERVGAVLSHTARGTLRPTQEDSLQERFQKLDLSGYRFGSVSAAGYRARRNIIGRMAVQY